MKLKKIKLGFFILGALAIFILATFSIRDFKILNPGYTIKVVFNFGDGIMSASPVRVAGVDAGEVRKVSIITEEGKSKVLVYAFIRKSIRIPAGSEAFINNLSILGQKYLEIMPKENPESYLEDGDMIIGNDSIPMYKVAEFARNIMVRFGKILGSLETIVADQDITQTFKKFIGNLEGASTSLEVIFNDLKSHQGTIGKLLYEDALYNELEEFLKDIKANPWKLLHKPKETKR